MSTDRKVLQKMIIHALSGKGSHVEVKNAFAGLDWKLAGIQPESATHSAFQLLNHIVYWNEWVLKWLDGQRPQVPEHAAGSWPGGPAPADVEEWESAVRRFERGLDDMTRQAKQDNLLAKGGAKTRLEMFQSIASHNSYHLGQVVSLRRRLASWPPPSGGLTW